MSKIKMPARSPKMDMTPMVDMFCLLLTFFMLTTSFRPQEAAQVDTPSSISEKITPDNNVMTIYISKDNKIFFNIDNGKDSTVHVRKKLLADMGTQYNIKFTEEQLQKFDKLPSFGMPIKDVAAWLDEKDSKLRDKMQIGIPMDSTDNQLAMWMLFARKVNPNAEAAVKGDMQADYKVAKKVFDILQDVKINKFNLTTNLEQVQVSLKDVK
jgi:biopolymer transport protein ExbD